MYNSTEYMCETSESECAFISLYTHRTVCSSLTEHCSLSSIVSKVHLSGKSLGAP